MKRLSKLAYKQLGTYEIVSYYKLCAISHAAGILANRRKSIKRGLEPRQPYAKKPLLVLCYGFKIADGILRVSLDERQYFDTPLNNYVKCILSDPSLKVRSFALTASTVSICYSKEITEIDCIGIEGVDRNLRNLTIGIPVNRALRPFKSGGYCREYPINYQVI